MRIIIAIITVQAIAAKMKLELATPVATRTIAITSIGNAADHHHPAVTAVAAVLVLRGLGWACVVHVSLLSGSA